MDERDDDLFNEEPPGLFEQEGPSLFEDLDDTYPDTVEIADPPTSDVPSGRSADEVAASLMDAVDARRRASGPVERPATPLALYRRYRPDTFAEVIGQEHVTEPLRRALLNNRVHHAYLFSGPRGCGKTTSARILARCLNCAAGPTPQPCGECTSCRDLARGGPGSIDVIEIDAASHGGVDDARELRERAFFSPVHSRYKIYIIDEAHMVTPQGFNALLKVVEEPPPHVKFIFATTEPEKVIGTIRSRTHHYPFRLVPPKVLSTYLGQVCGSEGIEVEPAVLPLVVRAGAGSVRDSLSVLDQLLGSASEQGVSYVQAAALLGFTPDALLDEIVDAFAAGDAHGIFAAIDKIIEVGQDPRRFAEDLLRRLRDLIIVAAVPDALTSGLVDVAADQAERLTTQASALGPGELTRAAEVIAVGLTEMRGTTAPRLHLELMCARLLLPGADVDDRGLHARLDRLERLVQQGVPAPETAAAQPPSSATPTRVAAGRRPEPIEAPPWDVPDSAAAEASDASTASAGKEAPIRTPARRPRSAARAATSAPASTSRRRVAQGPGEPPPEETPVTAVAPAAAATAGGSAAPATPAAPSAPDAAVAPPDATVATPDATVTAPDRDRASASASPPPGELTPSAAGFGTADLRRIWPDILEDVKQRRRVTWILLSQNAHVVEVRDSVLTLGLSSQGARESFVRGTHADLLRAALQEVVGATLHIEPIVDVSAATAATQRATKLPAVTPPGHPAAAAPSHDNPPAPEAPPTQPPTTHPASTHSASSHPASSHPAQAEPAQVRSPSARPSPTPPSDPPAEPSRDDDTLDDEFSGDDLLRQHLGAQLVTDEE